ncbi:MULTISPECIES: hypothetical protein [Acutalibacter]|jgi:hypothetical protein|uniref:hypothetical protein n=1 Tax=Acutalibacter TaxID=1918385 RepID=UPI0027296B6B|nr:MULTISPECIES: hypothetical protein [Acutalibacter]
MNVQMMDGLLGASSNIKLAGTPMSVYRQATDEGDTEKMKRALGYTGECTEKAVKYQEKLDEGMKAEAKAEKEKAKLEQEAAIEKLREEHKRAEESTESGRPEGTDLVQLSEAAKAALKNSQPVEAAEPVSSEPVIYTPTGEVSAVPAETEPSVSFSA